MLGRCKSVSRGVINPVWMEGSTDLYRASHKNVAMLAYFPFILADIASQLHMYVGGSLTLPHMSHNIHSETGN